MLIFDTDTFARPDRADAMSAAMLDATFSTNLLHESPADDVYMRMRQWQLGPVELVGVHCSGMRLVRTRRQTQRDDTSVTAIGLHHRGEGVQVQDGTPTGIEPGRLFVLEMTRPYDHRHIRPAISHVVKIPTEQLGLRPDTVARARTGVGVSPVSRLFTQHLRLLLSNAEGIDDDAAAMVGGATVELARALLISAAGDEHARAALDETLVLRVKGYVREHLQDPGLNAARIAAAHHVSVRYLYKVCAAADLSLEQWIIAQRLEGARRELTTPTTRRETIATVARRWGFASPSHFTHRFRAAYGMAPRDWQHLRTDAH